MPHKNERSLYEARIRKLTGTAEAKRLQDNIVTAVDAYIRFLEKRGLHAHISFERNTEPDAPDIVTQKHAWDDWRIRH
jgi:hypothetical protein